MHARNVDRVFCEKPIRFRIYLFDEAVKRMAEYKLPRPDDSDVCRTSKWKLFS